MPFIDKLKKYLKKIWIPPAILGITVPIYYYEELQNVYVITASGFMSGSLLMYLFPKIATFLFEKPLYFEDLNDNLKIDDSSKKYQKYFIISNGFFSSVLFASMINYFFFKYQESKLSVLELIGVLGGLLEFFKQGQSIFGEKLIQILNYYKKKEQQKILTKLNLTDIETGLVNIVEV